MKMPKGINIRINSSPGFEGFPCDQLIRMYLQCRETWVLSPSWKMPWEEEKASLQYSCFRETMDCTIHVGHKERLDSDWANLTHTSSYRQLGSKTGNKEKSILWYGKGGNGLEEVGQVLLYGDAIKKRKLSFTKTPDIRKKSKCCIRLCF